MSEWELRQRKERKEERRVEAEKLCARDQITVPPYVLTHVVHGSGVWGGHDFLCSHF